MWGFRWAAAAMLLAAPASAPAADWRVANFAFGEGNRGVTYVDTSSVKEKRGRIRFRSEQYLERPAEGYNRISALSEVDCASMKVTTLREAYYSGPRLVAFGQAPREASHYSSSTSQHWLLRRICEGEYLSDAVADHAGDSERMFALDWSRVPGRLSIAIPAVVPGRSKGAVMAAAAAGSASAAAPR
ncbi:MAG TPA: surface-adhesin E family protein [Allosphingosinicella sp.]|nr:surface-adhesin E family protein [Allosphingosinicella sp.]